MYCVYLTVYTGNKLPPFYIGSTSYRNIEIGYCGSVQSNEYKKIWKLENKINRHLFHVTIVKTFDDRQEAYSYEEYLQRKLDVLNNPLYVNKVIANKTFRLSRHSEKSKEKMSRSRKGKSNYWLKGKSPWNKGISRSEDTKQKIRETKKKNGSAVGEKNPNYGKSPSTNTRNKISLALKGKKYPSRKKPILTEERKQQLRKNALETHRKMKERKEREERDKLLEM